MRQGLLCEVRKKFGASGIPNCLNMKTRWRNYNQYALYLSVHYTALRADISAFVQRYLRPCPKISLSWPEDISARGFHAPINSANGL